MERLCRLR